VFRLFLGFLMLFAIGGAVVGGITYLRIQDQEKAAAESGTPAPSTNVTFIELDAVNVTLKRDEALETRSYIFVLEARPGSQSAVLKQRLKLRDTYTRYLATLAERAGPENIENIPYLRGQLTAAANEIVGQNVVQNVLIRSVISSVSG
jgi:hypothetical protein